MHYHVVEDQTKATHQRIPIDHQWFFFFIFFMFSQVQSVLHQLMTSVHAQLTYRLLSGLSSTDQLLCCIDQEYEYHQMKKALKVKLLKIRNSSKNWSEVKQNQFVGTCSRALLAYLVPVSITINISLLDWIGRIEYLLPALASLGSASNTFYFSAFLRIQKTTTWNRA